MTNSHTILLVVSEVLLTLSISYCQPPGGGPPIGGGLDTGSTVATGCTPNPATCASDGSSNYINRSLTYTNGEFSGKIKTNLCPNRALPTGSPTSTPSCIEQTFPVTTSTPSAAGLLGRVGMTLSGGVNIYGPFDAG